MRKLSSEDKNEFSGPDEFARWVKTFAKSLEKRELILLNGDLGTGKTFFMTNLLAALGGETAVSPSFAIHNHYQVPNGSIDHVDLYRLKDFDDLESTGFWDLFMHDGIIAVEWANKLSRDDFPNAWPIWEIEIQKNKKENESARQVFVRRWLSR